MTKQLHYFDENLRKKNLKAAETLAKIVGSTLGPRGRNVLVSVAGRKAFVTKDGVTISRAVQLNDPAEQVAADIIKQAAERTSLDAGDGTTTTTVLAHAILLAAEPYLRDGVAPIEIKRGMEAAVKVIEKKLTEMARPISSIEDVENVATISANGERVIGRLVAKAFELAGRDGVVTLEESRSVETTIDALEGFRFDSGYLSNAFITDERRRLCRHENVRVLVTDYDLSEASQIKAAAELIARDNKPLLVIANEVDNKALAALIANALRGSLKVVAVKAPRYGEERRDILEDLAIATGAKYFRRDRGDLLEDIKLTDFGLAKTIEVDRQNTTLIGVGGKQEDVEQRISDIQALYDAATEPVEAETLHQRLIRMNGGVVVVRVGGSTEVEMTEKKHRIEDALEAVRAAQAMGVVAGGGVALIHACRTAKEELKVLPTFQQHAGVSALLGACYAPYVTMAFNAGAIDVDVDHVQADWPTENTQGVDFSADNVIEDFRDKEYSYIDMFAAGIIDPAKVTVSAIKNAVSAASTLLTTDCAVIDLDEENA